MQSKKIELSHSRCISCAGCVGICPVDVLSLQGEHLTIEQSPCISCGLCIQFCPVGALAEGQDYGKKTPIRKSVDKFIFRVRSL